MKNRDVSISTKYHRIVFRLISSLRVQGFYKCSTSYQYFFEKPTFPISYRCVVSASTACVADVSGITISLDFSTRTDQRNQAMFTFQETETKHPSE